MDKHGEIQETYNSVQPKLKQCMVSFHVSTTVIYQSDEIVTRQDIKKGLTDVLL